MREITYKINENSCHICASFKCSPKRYPRTTIKGKECKIHRYVHEQTYGPIPDGMDVLHKCSNKMCINPKHLYLGTDKENAIDRVKNREIFLKFTVKQIHAIRDDKRTLKEIAKDYNVCFQTISRIKRGDRWSCV